MSTDGTSNVRATIHVESPSNAAPHCAIGVRGRVLEVADTCFEVFSSRELRKTTSVLQELIATYPDLSSADLLDAINLAYSWKRQLRRAARRVH